MKWTTDKPTQPGWYWHYSDIIKTTKIYELEEFHGHLYAVYSECASYSITHMSGKWAGPIPAPEE